MHHKAFTHKVENYFLEIKSHATFSNSPPFAMFFLVFHFVIFLTMSMQIFSPIHESMCCIKPLYLCQKLCFFVVFKEKINADVGPSTNGALVKEICG